MDVVVVAMMIMMEVEQQGLKGTAKKERKEQKI